MPYKLTTYRLVINNEYVDNTYWTLSQLIDKLNVYTKSMKEVPHALNNGLLHKDIALILRGLRQLPQEIRVIPRTEILQDIDITYV